MLDDDIQYLGMKTTPLPRARSVKSVTEFTLHVEKNGDERGYRMIFRKANANTIIVGRKPLAEHSSSSVYDAENSNASFRCPVVSRNHAEIKFSDGLLYVTDTLSRYGTHIRKPLETTSKMIPTQTPVQIEDGDVITFGRSVGKINDIVRPIVARVELGYSAPTPLTPTNKTQNKRNSVTSGRYGLRISDTSDGEASSNSSNDSSASDQPSDNDSDVVEVHPPLLAIVPSVHSTLRRFMLPTFNTTRTSSKDCPSPASLSASSPLSSSPTSLRKLGVKANEDVFDDNVARRNDIFDFGSPFEPDNVTAEKDRGTPSSTIRSKYSFDQKKRIFFDTPMRPGRRDKALRRSSHSRSTSPTGSAAPSSPQFPTTKNIGNDTTATSPVFRFALPDDDPFWPPLSSPPPLPSNSPPLLLSNQTSSHDQSASHNATVHNSKEQLTPPSGFQYPSMVDNCAQSPSHPKALSIGDLPAEEEVARESQQSSSQESPFAGHAEEEDIIFSPQEDSLELPRDPSSQPEAHQNDGAHGFEGGLESHVLGGSDAGDFSSAITALHEESLLEMDEQAFDEAHGDHAAVNGKNEESQVKNVQTSSNEVKALPGPATNVVQRAAAALSSLKERLSGSNSDYTSSGHGDVSVSPVSETRVKQLEDQLLSIKVVNIHFTGCRR
ncbi:hypothetical protein F5878DRAFT_188222 [Lentinula raphanica]|uniref:FHA domain-containing protein n=1 Tax=Lentinula raphanica TaxID=153919 RepID=A0AA38P830_9AGAR|nr:hypothetical protein F5878DRAFT_188222 [Lentinula raphanica]